MARFLVRNPDWQAGQILLPENEARHAVLVLRLRSGENIEIFDGLGNSACAVLQFENPRDFGRVFATDLQQQKNTPPPLPAIHLALALPKAAVIESLLPKMVELGISQIQPLITANSAPILRGKSPTTRLQKWQSIIQVACKQCGQNWLPQLEQPINFAEFIAKNHSFDLDKNFALCGALHPNSLPLLQICQQIPQNCEKILLFIGPEGDFSVAEYQQLNQKGIKFADFGKLTLRVETAATYAISVINAHLLAA